MKKIYHLLSWAMSLTPMIAMAAVSDFNSLVATFTNLVNTVLPALLALAGLIFIWGVIQYIINAGDPEKRSEGHKKMMYGLIGLFVLVSFWGILALVSNTLGLQGTTTKPVIPTF